MRIITPEEYFEATSKLAKGVRQEFIPDLIVPLGGGMVPGGMLQEMFKVKARCIDIGRKGDKRIVIYDLNIDVDGKRLLLLEDFVPSNRGKSLLMAKGHFENLGAEVRMGAPVVGENTQVEFYGLLLKEPFRVFWKPTR
ncbi:MAG: hypothetical protein ABIH34_00445 [Nanoarchaeota archaeon]